MKKPAIIFLLYLLCLCIPGVVFSQALERYVESKDPSYAWHVEKVQKEPGITIHILSLTSQKWKENIWSHTLVLLIPDEALNTGFCFLSIGGSANLENNLPLAKEIALRTKSPTAYLSGVPNQPLFDGKSEDALLAFTLKNYIDSGDESWPILFPMVKSGVKAMDAIQEYSKSIGIEIINFTVSGASKRGWTTYLVGAVDTRVKAIAPLVFDMLNMKAQTEWAEKAYGTQSEKIRNYTELGLIERISEPRTKVLRQWIDPYEYRERLSMPKLILLGTNDPYWVVDAQRHYYQDLTGSKLIYQVPNGDHHIGDDPGLINTVIEWQKLIVHGKKLPNFEWSLSHAPSGKMLKLKSDIPFSGVKLWQADAGSYDFRKAHWEAKDIFLKKSGSFEILLSYPEINYRAYVAEVSILSEENEKLSLSTTAFVLKKGGA
jgi:PhoPQ-activated pathogenicity-related protein